MHLDKLKGIILVTTVGVVVIILSYIFSFFNSILLGLLMGLIIGNLYNLPTSYQAGITVSSSKLLEFSIIFLAFGINIKHLNALGWQSLLIVFILIIVLLIATIFLSKRLNCPSRVGLLVGFGTAICGSSAIAALAPSVKENKEDIGVSIAVVNLYGTLGMVILPFVFSLFNLEEKTMSMIIGGSLHAVGNVVGAGYGISDTIGEQALAIKLARVALLGPAIIFFNLITNQNKTEKQNIFSLPWYVWGFIIISTLASFINLPEFVVKYASEIGKILLTLAMVAIGLKVKLVNLIKSGKKGLMFGFVIFAIQLLLLSLLIFMFY